jgi:hypothetical protein
VVDPITGDFIVMQDAATWYGYSPIGNSWSRRSGVVEVLTGTVPSPAEPAWGTVAATIHKYRVVVLVKAALSLGEGQMWLFKPAAGINPTQ